MTHIYISIIVVVLLFALWGFRRIQKREEETKHITEDLDAALSDVRRLQSEFEHVRTELEMLKGLHNDKTTRTNTTD